MREFFKFVVSAARYLLGEDFAEVRRGRKTWEEITNAYQLELRALYTAWLEELSEDVDDAEDDGERLEVIAAALLLLESKMKLLGRTRIRQGFREGFGDATMTGSAENALFIQIAGNDRYVSTSLIPDLDMRMRNALATPGFIALGSLGMINLLTPVTARVESYAGMMWGAINWGAGEASTQGDDRRISWLRDPRAQHCSDCLDYGDKEYTSFDDMIALTAGAMPGINVECNGNCYLPGVKVLGEFEAVLKSRYSGPAREMLTFSGNRLAVTANHPILSLRGWLPANRLREGDYVVSYKSQIPSLPVINENCEGRPASVEDLFKAFAARGGTVRARSGSTNFHGDAQWADGNVDIVAVDWKLLPYVEPLGPKSFRKIVFEPTAFKESSISGIGTGQLCPHGIPLASPSFPSGAHLSLNRGATLLDRLPFKRLRRGSPPDLDAMLRQASPEGTSGDSLAITHLLQGHPSIVFADKIVNIIDFHFRGHVYDLQTATGTMIAENIVASNCRCWLEYIVDGEFGRPPGPTLDLPTFEEIEF